MINADMIIDLNNQVRLITNPSIFSFVRRMLDCAPPGFYERPASLRHHPLDERGESGNLLHTVRVVKMVLILVDACSIVAAQKDILVASAVLHDLCRHGLEGDSECSCKNHPSLVRKIAEDHNLTCEYYGVIMRIIENHMGRWGDQPFTPRMGLDEILHLADCICARGLEVMQC